MDFSIDHEALSSVVENIISGICIFSLAGNRDVIPVYLNEGFYRMLGYSHKDLDRMLKNIRRNIIPDDLPIFEQGIDDILKDDGAVEFEFRTVTGDGNIRWLQVRGNLYGKMDGYPLLSGIIIDATERKTIEEELALQAERINILSESVHEHFLDYNSKTDVMSIVVNKSAFQKPEVVLPEFMSSTDFPIVHPEDAATVREVMDAARKSPISDQIDFRSNYFNNISDNNYDKVSNEYHWYRANITSVRGADGYVARIVGRITEIDLEKKKELELQMKADKDSLTGLYNKGTATALIIESIKKTAAAGQKGALLMLDLDHFKSVNDTFGHSAGDKVIENAGKVLQDTFKGRDIVGRMGGDEFMVFMSGIKDKGDALIMARNLNEYLTRRIENSQGVVTVTASIGIAICDESNDDYQTLYNQADAALYRTKENGRNGCTLYGEAE